MIKLLAGERRYRYHMEPMTEDRRPVHGGNHGASADTVEAAREFARRILDRGFIDYCLCRKRVESVHIVGAWWQFTGEAWQRVPGVAAWREVIRAGACDRCGRPDAGHCLHCAQCWCDGYECRECPGHPAITDDPLSEMVYCDGSCRRASRVGGRTQLPLREAMV